MPSDLPSFGACCPVCKEPVVTMVPGPPGADGAAGSPGAGGINAFTLLTDDYELPAVNTSAVAEVGLSTWAQIGQIVILSDGSNVAYMRVMAKPAVGQMTLLNLGYSENAAPTTSFPVGSGIGPAGQQGAAGVADAGELADKVPVAAVAVANVALTGEQTIDGVSLVAGDRVLLVGQGVAAQNGIYTVAAGSWVRAPDMDSDAKVFQGVTVMVTQGANYALSEWILTTGNPITLDATNLVFELWPWGSQALAMWQIPYVNSFGGVGFSADLQWHDTGSRLGVTGIIEGRNGISPLVDPTDAWALWAADGGMRYRTSEADEGDGDTRRLHNRGERVRSDGTDATVSDASMGELVFGTTQARVVLPSPGTYLIWAMVHVVRTGAADVSLKIHNNTDTEDVSGEYKDIDHPSDEQNTVTLQELYTVASGGKQIGIHAHQTAGAGSAVAEAGLTLIGYVRLF